MHTLDAAKFFSGLACRIQTAGANRGVTVLMDVGTQAWFRLDGPTFEKQFFCLVLDLIQGLPSGAVCSVVTHFEPAQDETAVGDDTSESKHAGQSFSMGYTLESKKHRCGRLAVDIVAPLIPSVDYATLTQQLALFLKYQGGNLRFWSNQGKARITLELPHAVEPQGLHKDPDSRLKALIVEDEPEMQEILTTILEAENFDVVTAADGFSALLHIERQSPDVVLTDLLLPNMHGLDLISRITTSRPQLPIVIFTGFPEALSNIPDPFKHKVLQKPFHAQDLLAALAEVLPFVRK